jgi:hypothetical protein
MASRLSGAHSTAKRRATQRSQVCTSLSDFDKPYQIGMMIYVLSQLR